MSAEGRHFQHDLYRHPGSFVLISPFDSVDTAVVFVHGFGGDPWGTWSDFHEMIDQWRTEWWSKSDVFFYEYPSVPRQVPINALKLVEFLAQIYPIPEDQLFEISSRDLGFDLDEVLLPLWQKRLYRKLVLVGHSEGGLVIRHAMLRCLQLYENRAFATTTQDPAGLTQQLSASEATDRMGAATQLLSADLRLFAPAICGYRPAGIKGVLATLPFFGSLLGSLLNFSPAIQDMKPEELASLRTETENGARQHPDLSGLKATILWGVNEKLLKACWFNCDDPRTADGKNHLTVCKPAQNYKTPLDIICE